MNIFVYRTRIEAPAEEVFRWHSRPGAFERLTPPWEKVKVVERSDGIRDGPRVVLTTFLGLLPQQWVLEHRGYEEGRQFHDVQISGPFSHWEHTHTVEPEDPSSCYLEDRIEYILPMGLLGSILGTSFVNSKLKKIFSYRHRTLKRDVALHNKYAGDKPMQILVTGSTGLIGSRLTHFLAAGGHSVTRLTRSESAKSKFGETLVYWNPDKERIDTSALQGHDAVIHLAGENIAGRWTEEKKKEIRNSRVNGTRFLTESLAKLGQPPKVLVCASAIGYYGNRGDEILTEESPPGEGFLAEVCKEWEAATEPAIKKGIRVVHMRFGVVLSPKGGALGMMLLPFRAGFGGKVGSGDQYWSWIAIDDVIGAIYHAVANETVAGPVNTVSPNPVTNQEFTKILGKVLNRPTFLSVPAFAARLALGSETADEMLLSSVRAVPIRLLDAGYEFQYPELEGALRHLLGK